MGKKSRLKNIKPETFGSEPNPSAPTLGVTLFGVLLLISSLVHMQKLVSDKDIYFQYYSFMPPWLALTRYSFSWFQRIVGILAAAGILARKKIGRTLAFIIGWFTVLTVYWKHPYDAVKVHTAYLDQRFSSIVDSLGADITFSSITPLAVVGLCLADIVFWAIFYYYFTRPRVKSQFS